MKSPRHRDIATAPINGFEQVGVQLRFTSTPHGNYTKPMQATNTMKTQKDTIAPSNPSLHFTRIITTHLSSCPEKKIGAMPFFPSLYP